MKTDVEHKIKIVSKAHKADTFVAVCACGRWYGSGSYNAGPNIMDNARLHLKRNGVGEPDA